VQAARLKATCTRLSTRLGGLTSSIGRYCVSQRYAMPALKDHEFHEAPAVQRSGRFGEVARLGLLGGARVEDGPRRF